MDSSALSPVHPSRRTTVAVGGIPEHAGAARLGEVDPLPSFFQSQCLLPAQYNALVRKSAQRAGESRLLLAVLKDALRIYLKTMDRRTAQARREFHEICQWFYAKDQEGLFAYEHLCEALGIEPGALRRWLMSLRRDAYRPNGRPIAGR
jgi:hypothetical protein